MKSLSEISDKMLLTEMESRLKIKHRLVGGHQKLMNEIEVLNQKLMLAERTKSGFLSNVRNELNNPLTSILGLTSLILSSSDLESTRSLTRLVYDEVFKFNYQMRNILAAAEIEAGEVHINPTKINLIEIIDDQINYFNQKLSERKINTIRTHHSEITNCNTDSEILKISLMNLIGNAIEFSPDGSSILIDSWIDEIIIRVRIKDFGEGINSENGEQVFERFSQLDTGTTKRHQGHGLGLSIVREYVDCLGGQVFYFSLPDHETVFEMQIPISKTEGLVNDDGLFKTVEMF